MTHTIPAVVHSTTSINGYGAMWSLNQAKVPVVGLFEDFAPHVHSKLTMQNIQVPHENADPDGLIAKLVELGEQAGEKRVLYMLSDLGAFLASTHREQLEPYYLHPWMDWQLVRDTLHRRDMFDAAERANVPLPATWWSDDQQWEDLDIDQLPYPIMLKPMVSRFDLDGEAVKNPWSFTRKYGKAIELHSPEEFRRIAPDLRTEATPVCAQQRIQCEIDDLWTHHFYSVEGEIQVEFTGYKLDQVPDDFGTGSICRSAPNEEISELSRRFLAETKFTGVGNIEYIRTDNGYLFVEINPRSNYWSSLATGCGINLYYAMYLHMTGEDLDPLKGRNQKNGRVWYDIGHIGHYLASKNKRISPLSFLFSRKMEAIANLGDYKIALRRYGQAARLLTG